LRTAIRIARESSAATAAFAEETGIRVDVHVGVHSALVIVREATETAGDAALEIAGNAPRWAAVLDDRAQPGEILVSADTWRLLRGEFAAEAAGTVNAPDGSRPLAFYRVTGEMTRRSTPADAASARTPIV